MRKVISLEFDCEKCIRYLKLHSGTWRWFLSAVFTSYLYSASFYFCVFTCSLRNSSAAGFNERITAGLFKFCTRGVSISSAGMSSVVRLRSQLPVWKSPNYQHKRSHSTERKACRERGSFSLRCEALFTCSIKTRTLV